MRKLHFYYSTTLEFSAPVCEQYFVLRCQPGDTPNQQIRSLSVALPPGTHCTPHTDGFGNRLLVGSLPEPHSSFFFTVTGTAFLSGEPAAEPCPGIYRYPTEKTRLDGTVLEAFPMPAGLTLHERAWALSQAVHAALEYRPFSTTLQTTAAEAYAKGCGVCQDYAQLLLGLLRAAGIPARYVAGLFEGEGSTHAWVEYYDGSCWHGVDPTRNRRVAADSIKLSHGRDSGDCQVDRGTFKGGADQLQTVYMKVTPG